jgi:hypothetical protein
MKQRMDITRLRADARIARLNAFWVTLALGAYLVVGRWWILAFLFSDFLLRGFLRGRMSPIAALSRRVVASLESPSRLQWAVPKIFAARLGCAYSLLALVADLAVAGIASKALVAGFIVLTSLEAFAGYCVGCRIHSALYRVGILRGAGRMEQG